MAPNRVPGKSDGDDDTNYNDHTATIKAKTQDSIRNMLTNNNTRFMDFRIFVNPKG